MRDAAYYRVNTRAHVPAWLTVHTHMTASRHGIPEIREIPGRREIVRDKIPTRKNDLPTSHVRDVASQSTFVTRVLYRYL